MLASTLKMGEFREILEWLENGLQEIDGQITIREDFNARAIQWGMPQTQQRTIDPRNDEKTEHNQQTEGGNTGKSDY